MLLTILFPANIQFTFFLQEPLDFDRVRYSPLLLLTSFIRLIKQLDF